MFSSIYKYLTGLRRITFRYIDSNGIETEIWGYKIDKTLSSKSTSIAIEGESGIPSSTVINLFDIPYNVREIKCKNVKIDGNSLFNVNLNNLDIENCDIINCGIVYIGRVNHLRISQTNMDFFELYYPEQVHSIDIINTSLKFLPNSLSRCTFLESHLNIPYSISTEEHRRKRWFGMFFAKAEKEFNNLYSKELNERVNKYINEFGLQGDILTKDMNLNTDIDLEAVIEEYENRYAVCFPFSDVVQNNMKEIVI
jgi:hypothetical protein